MLSQVIGQPPGTTKRGIGKPLEMPKGYEAYGHIFKGTGKPQGNTPLHRLQMGKYFYWPGMTKEAISQ